MKMSEKIFFAENREWNYEWRKFWTRALIGQPKWCVTWHRPVSARELHTSWLKIFAWARWAERKSQNQLIGGAQRARRRRDWHKVAPPRDAKKLKHQVITFERDSKKKWCSSSARSAADCSKSEADQLYREWSAWPAPTFTILCKFTFL